MIVEWIQEIQERLNKELNCHIILSIEDVDPKFINNLQSPIQKGLFSSDFSLKNWINKSQRALNILKEKLDKIKITTTTKELVWNSKTAYFDIEVIESTLKVIISENYYFLVDG